MSSEADRKRECRALKKYGIETKLAFAVNHLGSSQKNLLIIQNINKLVKDNPLLDLCVFAEEVKMPCLECKFPIYHTSQVQIYDGTIVSSDFSIFRNISKITRPKHIYYMYDLEWKQQYHGEWHYEMSYFKEMIKNIRKVTRSTGYSDIIEQELNQKIVKVIEDFNIEQFLEMINDR